jgi:NhaP-type Na+/H+ or K+/H+ antiporter
VITVGPLLTWGLCAFAAYFILDLSGAYAVLLGAILIVSGPTVVVPLLEFVRPKARIQAVLKWEAIMIDPIGATIGVLVFHALVVGNFHRATTIEGILDFLLTVGVGALIGFTAAAIVVVFLARHWLPENLDNIVTLAYIAGAVTISEVLAEESGLMAATVMGFTLANQKFVNVEKIIEFKENLRIILISGLFIILTARLTMEQITDALTLRWFAFLLFLVLVVRPVVVAVVTLGTSLTRNEKIFMGWMDPRGIIAASTASTFALGLSRAGFPNADRLIALTFLTIVGTVLIYGLTALPLARRLNLLEEVVPHQAQVAQIHGDD